MRQCVGLVLLVLLGCGGAQTVALPPQDPASTVVLLPTEELGQSFMAQQKLEGRYGERDFSLDVVLQLVSGKLTLVGLTPFGTRAFVLEQEGTEVRLEKYVDRELPFDPRYVLDDVHRVFFRGLAERANDGVTSGESHGELVTEVWRAGMLVERRFRRLNGTPHGEVVVTFEGAKGPVVAPTVTLENGWFGYRLRVTTLAQQYL